MDTSNMSLDDIIKSICDRNTTRFRSSSASGNVQQNRTRGGGVTKPYRSNVNSTWKHHQRQGFGARRGAGAKSLAQSNLISKRLVVSNLYSGVTDSDMKNLFSKFGSLKNATVHYNSSGRSLGTADVTFKRKANAIKAMKYYNETPIDKRSINVEFTTANIPLVIRGNRSRSNTGAGSTASNNNRRFRNRNWAQRRKGTGNKTQERSAEDPRNNT